MTAHVPTIRPTTLTPARPLLMLGVAAGPLYVAAGLAQALTREGFDLTRHSWSLLANGDLGWIQTANFLVTALLTIAAAAGLRTALAGGPGAARPRGARWAPALVAVFGVSLIGAAVFPADPALGFPAGTPDGPGTVTATGLAHLAVGGIGFSCMAAACYVIASRFAREGRRGWAIYSRVTGTAFLMSFAGIASGGGAAWSTLGFVAGMVAVWCWLSLVSLHFARATA
ncbi:DUF998 domain-containing protein [Nonomuraea sp. NPDC049504]|jgi:hypothetical protein|uniref:DUF998 domain-containing protein n=1 Tax=Nonomuraea sp. NPDC049504 TaxID=3154729 RepID=UPI00341C9C3D